MDDPSGLFIGRSHEDEAWTERLVTRDDGDQVSNRWPAIVP
jgi:hypothetical protein